MEKQMLEGKAAIITGASYGMGQTMAELFAEEGASVVLTARGHDKLETVVGVIRAKGRKAIGVVADVCSVEDTQRVFNETIKEFGDVDILINNAGIGEQKMIDETEDEWMLHVMNTNLGGPMRYIREALKIFMPKNDGVIINISSVNGTRPFCGATYYIGLLLALGILGLLSGCGGDSRDQTEINSRSEEELKSRTAEETTMEEENEKESRDKNAVRVTPTSEITELETGLSMVRYEGEYGFDTFLEQGGAASDADAAAYITSLLAQEIQMEGAPFGCSTLSVENQDGGYLFGRNFDWNACNGLIVSARPEKGYFSVSTVNMDFIRAGGLDISQLPDSMQAFVSLYAPLDGMNEKGMAVSVNMIQDSVSIHQDTAKPDLTTTTAVRLLLDKAANVEEALELLQQYDFHSSMGMMVHLVLADADGRSVAVEYVDNEMIVIETPVVTNFYLADGEKQGIGTAQSHTRYEILTQTLEERGAMIETEVRDALDSVSKDNFGEFEHSPQGGMRSRGSSETDSECPLETTEWSIVMNQETKELIYYHREDYKTAYVISVK